MKGEYLTAIVGTTPSIVLPANPHRRTLKVGCSGTGGSGSFSWSPGGSTVTGIATTSPGTVASYTVPTGKVSLVTACQFALLGGTAPVIKVQANIGGTLVNVASLANTVVQNPQLTLNAGDSVQIQCTSGGASSSVSAVISTEDWSGTSTGGADVWLGFGQQPANGVGLPVFGGVTAQEYSFREYGTAIGLDVWAVAAAANTQIAILSGYD